MYDVGGDGGKVPQGDTMHTRVFALVKIIQNYKARTSPKRSNRVNDNVHAGPHYNKLQYKQSVSKTSSITTRPHPHTRVYH